MMNKKGFNGFRIPASQGLLGSVGTGAVTSRRRRFILIFWGRNCWLRGTGREMGGSKRTNSVREGESTLRFEGSHILYQLCPRQERQSSRAP
ncbi:hypothetical protein GYMLUDRAFT_967975 [Collybiopsis luxurians FD-317 M1]|uniref:Uncharacterized protein n=1 Tax=Collybiopsis luxurians FD-317 M1 TaxID=944289 RepID=A0A0D0BS48_9AGAR|nr:hypothetical protein GYMLUDRAFT_967975 [Collybiopsis luxurians FD-317 M1]